MKIFRVEAALSIIDEYSKLEHCNLGPYQGRDFVINAFNHTYLKNRQIKKYYDVRKFPENFDQMTSAHPRPDDDQDVLFWSDGNYLCGFRTLEELKNWFNRHDLELLAKCHFMISEYNLSPTDDNYLSNKHQTVFNLDDSVLVRMIDLNDFIPKQFPLELKNAA